MQIAHILTDLIGNTPLLALERYAPGARILAKLECFNPLSSAKDRAALYMIRDAEARGLLRPGSVLVAVSYTHLFVGSNADLPIVGGSILSHDHFQGGRYTFAMEKAPVERAVSFPGYADVEAGIVKWPMSVLRLRCADDGRLVDLADRVPVSYTHLLSWCPPRCRSCWASATASWSCRAAS